MKVGISGRNIDDAQNPSICVPSFTLIYIYIYIYFFFFFFFFFLGRERVLGGGIWVGGGECS